MVGRSYTLPIEPTCSVEENNEKQLLEDRLKQAEKQKRGDLNYRRTAEEKGKRKMNTDIN